MDLNVKDIAWAMLQISMGFFFAGHFLGKSMRMSKFMESMRPANRSIATHQVMRVVSASWYGVLIISALALFFFSAVYYPSDRLRSPIPWDTIGLAIAIYLMSLVIVRLFTLHWHIKLQEVLVMTGGVSMFVALGVSTPGLLVGSIFVIIITWKITGSRGYGDGMVLREYLMDRARDYYGRNR